MAAESYEAWLDAMPIDDVRGRIERLEQELSDLHTLARLHQGRQSPPPKGEPEYGSSPP